MLAEQTRTECSYVPGAEGRRTGKHPAKTSLLHCLIGEARESAHVLGALLIARPKCFGRAENRMVNCAPVGGLHSKVNLK